MGQIENLLIDSSRAIADLTITKINGKQESFDELVQIMLKNQYPVSMRAARLVQLVGIKEYQLVQPHLDTFLLLLRTTHIDGVKRSILKVISEAPLTVNEEHWGELTDLCFDFVAVRNQAIAIRAFSADILIKAIQIYPELKPELIAVFETIWPDGSKGLKNKIKKLLVKLNK